MLKNFIFSKKHTYHTINAKTFFIIVSIFVGICEKKFHKSLWKLSVNICSDLPRNKPANRRILTPGRSHLYENRGKISCNNIEQ